MGIGIGPLRYEKCWKIIPEFYYFSYSVQIKATYTDEKDNIAIATPIILQLSYCWAVFAIFLEATLKLYPYGSNLNEI